MAQDQPLIPFAYLLNTPGAPAAPKDDGSPKHVPNSQVALALPQLRDLFNVPDWHPWAEAGSAGLRVLSFAEWAGTAGKCRTDGIAGGLHRAADGGLQGWITEEF
jgi:hypothetical protein